MGCSSEDSCDPTTSSIANVQSPANFSASEETQHGSLSCMTNSSDQNTQDVKPEVATPKIEVKTETSDQDSDNQVFKKKIKGFFCPTVVYVLL